MKFGIIIQKIFWLVLGIACTLSILGFAGHWLWPFNQISHFRGQYFTVLVVCLAYLVFSRFYYAAVLAGSLALVNLSLLIPLYMSGHSTDNENPKLRIISANVYAENKERHQLSSFVEQANPDFLALFEVDDSWSDVTQSLAQRFNYSRIEPTTGYFGIALFSQYPIKSVEMRKFASNSQYAIIAHLAVNNKPFHIIAAHVPAPTKKKYFDLRNKQLLDLANTAMELRDPVMLIGDLNITPWSPYFDDVIKQSNLVDSRKGFGIQATWPVQFSLMQIPIDHCLVSPTIEIQQWSRGPDIGSDQYPIIIDFAIDRTTGPIELAAIKTKNLNAQMVDGG